MLRTMATCACAFGLTFSAANYDPMANWLTDYKKQFEWVTTSTVSFIEYFEGMRTKAYQDSQGNWTIGVGHYIKAQEAHLLHRELSEDEVRGILSQDLEKCSEALKTALKVDITESQRDALQSLCHNIGPDKMAKSDVVKYLNQGQPKKAANAFLNWANPPELLKRRKIERQLFLSNI